MVLTEKAGVAAVSSRHGLGLEGHGLRRVGGGLAGEARPV